MTRFIADVDNLILIMKALKDKSRYIQFEAFHVFKVCRLLDSDFREFNVSQVFVANPAKAPAIVKILYRNKVKLLEFLNDFQNDKSDDQFAVSLLHTRSNPYRLYVETL